MQPSLQSDVVIYDRPGRKEIEALVSYFENERRIMDAWWVESTLSRSKHAEARRLRAIAKRKKRNK